MNRLYAMVCRSCSTWRVAYGVIALLLPVTLISAAPGFWYGGGGYDGHDQLGARPAIGCPQVSNSQGATNVLATTAWLNGTLLATGAAPTTVYIYWGTTNGGSNKVVWGAPIDLGIRTEGESLTTLVSVDPDTTYYFRFYATNTAGDAGWADTIASFLTPTAPVLTAGAGALPISYTTATLHGELVVGMSADLKVYWGQDTNVWSGTNHLGTLSQGAFHTRLSGLSSGAVYYYRWFGVNAYGSGWSETVAFTTRVESVVFAGGSYDGYMHYDVQDLMSGLNGSLFMIQ